MTSRVDADQYRKACGRFATGVAVATVMKEDGTATGLTISSFTSVSMDPPLVLFCIHCNSQILPHFQRSRGFGVNILSAEQIELSHHFSRRLPVPSASLRWQRGSTGVPVLEGASAVLECRLDNALPGGDHEILMGEVVALSVGEGNPLVRYGGVYCTLETPVVLSGGGLTEYERGRDNA